MEAKGTFVRYRISMIRAQYSSLEASSSNCYYFDLMYDLAVIPQSFYERSTLNVASDLLGKFLVRQAGNHRWIGKIVEVTNGESTPEFSFW